MKKLRLVLLVAVASLALGACSATPTGPDDCSGSEICVKPVSGS